MNVMKTLLKSQQGSVVTIVALCMVVMLGMTALVTDVGLVYLKKTKLKSAIDAAVLAGAQELPYNSEKAKSVAKEYAALNGVDPALVTVTVAPDSKSLTVKASKGINLVFANLLGYSSRQITAQTTGVVGPISKLVGGVMPIAVPERPPENPFIFGQEYELKTDGTTGWFGFVALRDPGNKILEANLISGYNGTLAVGDIIETESGNKDSSTDVLQGKVDLDPHFPRCTSEHYTLPCPRVVTLIVIDGPFKTGRSEAQVTGFASFLINQSYSEGGSGAKVVRGSFLREIGIGEIDTNGTGFGLNGVKLTQ